MNTLRAVAVYALAGALGACSTCSRSPAPIDNVVDTGPAAPSADIPQDVTLDRACADFSAAVCGRMGACTPFLLQSIYGDPAFCATRTALQCKPMVAATGSQASPGQIETCAKVIAAEDCAQALDNPSPAACDISGMLADGAPCAASQQCQTGYCKIAAGTLCGTCIKRVGAHFNCAVDADCVAGLVCDRGACASPGNIETECGPTAPMCSRALTCNGGLCRKPGAAGTRCTQPTDCDGNLGLYCNILSRQCTALVIAQANQPCGIVGKQLVACTRGATCLGGRCIPPAADGSSCNVLNGPECMPPAACISGRCVVPDPASCR